MKQQSEYLVNPDVVLREEDPDGALLFNPDTNSVKVLNTSGLFIWKLCRAKQTQSSLISAIKDQFQDVPEQQVEADVRNFLTQMTESGFLGTLDSQ
jgi:hypothetical protein